jgi:hypothetical protein
MEQLTFQQLVDNIVDTLAEADGETIAKVHNSVCSQQVTYVGDSMWEAEEKGNE